MNHKREIFLGAVGIGGDHPVSVQSMTTTPPGDATATLRQIGEMARAGGDIVRVALPDERALPAFAAITAGSPLPVVADIHFDARLAIAAMERGAAGVRINPGNVGGRQKFSEVLRAAKDHRIPLRLGVNSGSIEKGHLLAGKDRARALVDSLLDHVHYAEDCGFTQLKLSVKSSDIRETVAAYREVDRACDYPLHVGLTEAGTLLSGAVKSSLGLAPLLLEGIGNTLRVSLTADPVREVEIGRMILRFLGLSRRGLEVISCPTCGRTSVDLIPRVEEFECQVRRRGLGDLPLKVAIMGCEVNGPGEAAEADLGVAFSRRQGFLFQRGQAMEKVPQDQAIERLLERVAALAAARSPREPPCAPAGR